jgi:hypothetical protein
MGEASSFRLSFSHFRTEVVVDAHLFFTVFQRIRDVLSRIRIRPLLQPGSGSPIWGVKKHRIPDPTYFCIKAINQFCLLIPDPDPTIAPSRIPDPGGKKAPDPGSGSATLQFSYKFCATVVKTFMSRELFDFLL